MFNYNKIKINCKFKMIMLLYEKRLVIYMLKSVGIICEYNPFHNGHLYHLNKIKEMYPNDIIILVTQGYFTERGDISIMTKKNKTSLCLDMGIDLIIELPFIFATQSADIFAYGAISILNYLKVDKIVFGSECNDINLLSNMANIQLNDNQYNNIVKKYLNSGVNYPTALSKAICDITGKNINLPNDLLGISYIKAIKKLDSNIVPICIKRTNDYHTSNIENNITSASNIRKRILSKEDISNLVPNELLKYPLENKSLNDFFHLLKYKIISEQKHINIYQTVDEGFENRIIKNIYNSHSIDELILKCKTKRYTYNKINRMLVHILCNFTKEEANKYKEIQYIRVLGFNKNGSNYLKQRKKDISIPIITKLSDSNSEMLLLEQRVTNIFSLILNNDDIIKEEYQSFPIIKD